MTLFCHSRQNLLNIPSFDLFTTILKFGKHIVGPHLSPTFGTILHPAIIPLLSEVFHDVTS